MKRLIMLGLLIAFPLLTAFTFVAPGEFFNNLPTSSAAATSLTLSDQEIADLVYMREEEKLAHDVYTFLYSRWELPIFSNIAASELTHTNAVLSLLERYGIDDPAKGLQAGEFRNQDLQTLYNQLIAAGNQSQEDALRVGAAIEEIDIRDLDNAIEASHSADIQQIYRNLQQGSNNHLRAFAGTLEGYTGSPYTPQYLSTEAYQAVMAGSSGNGQRNNRSGNRGFGNGNQP